jgi:beta-phosphoglucomutase
MYYKGVIFDFNGTLYWDTPYHEQAWDLFLENHGIAMLDEEKNQKIFGRTNRDILGNIFMRSLSDSEIKAMSLEKELCYQQICLRTNMKLASGATDFFEYLMHKNIPFAIATSCGKENIDFYFEHFALEKWLARDKVIYNNGTFRGKPSADIYLLAATHLKLNPQEIIVFEDSAVGIQAAKNAGAGKIIIVNSGDADNSEWSYDMIASYDEVDRGLFVSQGGD